MKAHLSRVNRQIGNGQDRYNLDRKYRNSFPLYEMRKIGLGDRNAVARNGFFRMKVLSLLRLIYTLLSTPSFLKGLRISIWGNRTKAHEGLVGRQDRYRQILSNSTRVKRQRYIALSLRKETKIVRKNMPALYAPRLQQGG